MARLMLITMDTDWLIDSDKFNVQRADDTMEGEAIITIFLFAGHMARFQYKILVKLIDWLNYIVCCMCSLQPA